MSIKHTEFRKFLSDPPCLPTRQTGRQAGSAKVGKVTIRLSRPVDGPIMGGLAEGQGFYLRGVDWTNMDAGWLIAEKYGRIVGMMHVALGRPIGRLEMMCLLTDLTPTIKARISTLLLAQGIEALRQSGASYGMGMVDKQSKNWRKAVKRRGAVNVCNGEMLGYRL